jgi:hypothetical protein
MNISTDFSKAAAGREILIGLSKTNNASLAKPISEFAKNVGEFRTNFRSIGQGAFDYDYDKHKIMGAFFDFTYTENQYAKMSRDYIAYQIKDLAGQVAKIDNDGNANEKAKAIEQYLSKKIFKFAEAGNLEKFNELSPDHVCDAAAKLRDKVLLNKLLVGTMKTAEEKSTPEYKKAKEEKNKELQIRQINKEIAELNEKLKEFPEYIYTIAVQKAFENNIREMEERHQKISDKAKRANLNAITCLKTLLAKLQKSESLENVNLDSINPEEITNFFSDNLIREFKHIKSRIVNAERRALLIQIKEKEDKINVLKGIPIKNAIPEQAPKPPTTAVAQTIVVDRTDSIKPPVNPPDENSSQPEQKKSCIDKLISFFSAIGNLFKRFFKFIFRIN